MLKKLQKKSEGFTIIEVMIVLAIAGLILLIVFLAVPALQRNSRNTQRKSDVGRIGTAATTVASNNNNNMARVTTAAVQAEVGTLGFYDATAAAAKIIAVAPLAATSPAVDNATAIDTVTVLPGAKCSNEDAVPASRQIAVFYSIESGTGAPTRVCIDA